MLLKGIPVAESILNTIKQEISVSSSCPGLAVILIGDDPASEVYVGMKANKAKELGMHSQVHRLSADVSLDHVLELINQLNHDSSIHGILVQMPLPKHLNPAVIIEAISPNKDVDGLHPINMGKLLLGETDGFAPCTPAGIIEMLHYYNIPLLGKHVAVVGRSNIVGKPLAAMLMQKHPKANATVTLLHSQSINLPEILKTADIVVAAVGVPHFIQPSMLSNKAVVIDVGTSRVPADNAKGYTLIGDVDFANVVGSCQAISPVPGGVGPMTVAMLMKNTWKSYQKSSC